MVFKHLLYTSLCVKCWKYSEKNMDTLPALMELYSSPEKMDYWPQQNIFRRKIMTLCKSAISKEQISFREQKTTSFHLLMFPSSPEQISWCNTQHVSVCFISVARIVCLHACSPFFLHPVSPVGRGQQTSVASCLLCPSLWGFKRLLLLHSSSCC